MPTKSPFYLTAEDVRIRLRMIVDILGPQEMARQAGVSVSYVRDVLRGSRAPTSGLLPLAGVRDPGRLYELVQRGDPK